MCGIAGYAGQDGNKEKLKAMTKALERRGPDDEGYFESNGNSGKLGFGFRRLSIIDIKTGHQPLSNEDETIWVMLNGEIYDFQPLREKLLNLGHKFKTLSDTEVIAHAYEEWQEDCFKYLDGMFAIAIWDTKKEKLVLGRDRLGKKPLYWTIQRNTLWFASELKALMAANAFKKDLNINSVALFFRTETVPTPHTIFKNVYKLEPATSLSWDNGEIKKNRFWSYPENNFAENVSEENVVEEAKKRIDDSVRKRLISDVPLGLFLSGGLDSTVVAESASRQTPGLEAFTLGFEDRTYDETDSAKTIAKHLGLKHQIEILSEKKSLEEIENMVELLDEPLADPSILPQLLLSRFTRKRVTVALSGDGGDELLLGYQHIPAHIWRENLSFLPPFFWRANSKVLNAVPSDESYFSLGFKAQRLARGLGIGDRMERDSAWRGAFEKENVMSLFIPEIREQINIGSAEDILKKYAAEAPDRNSWSAWSWSYLRTFLMDDVMVKVDRATMWCSLEARAPLLDSEVVSFFLGLSNKYKLGTWRGKRLFKEILKDKIPQNILNSPKHGFGVPVSRWLNGALKNKVAEVSGQEFLKKQNLFNHSTINQLINDHASGKKDRRKELWAFFSFQLWYIKWYSQ